MCNDRTKDKARARAAEADALGELGTPLEDLVRRSARRNVQQATEAKVQTLLPDHENVWLLDGRLSVVRNGYLPSREILTGIGPVAAQVPKMRDRCGSGVKFQSGLVPAYVRSTPRAVEEVRIPSNNNRQGASRLSATCYIFSQRNPCGPLCKGPRSALSQGFV